MANLIDLNDDDPDEEDTYEPVWDQSSSTQQQLYSVPQRSVDRPPRLPPKTGSRTSTLLLAPSQPSVRPAPPAPSLLAVSTPHVEEDKDDSLLTPPPRSPIPNCRRSPNSRRSQLANLRHSTTDSSSPQPRHSLSSPQPDLAAHSPLPGYVAAPEYMADAASSAAVVTTDDTLLLTPKMREAFGLDSDMNSGVELKHTIDLPSMLKQPIQRIICIPDENGHVVDLQRVQYISPLEDGSYKVTLVSGWEMKLTDKLYSREKLIGQWRMLQNKQ